MTSVPGGGRKPLWGAHVWQSPDLWEEVMGISRRAMGEGAKERVQRRGGAGVRNELGLSHQQQRDQRGSVMVKAGLSAGRLGWRSRRASGPDEVLPINGGGGGGHQGTRSRKAALLFSKSMLVAVFGGDGGWRKVETGTLKWALFQETALRSDGWQLPGRAGQRGAEAPGSPSRFCQQLGWYEG